MSTVETTGKTIEEAIEAACKELNVQESDLKIEILDEPNKGILGFGTKMAKIRASVADTEPISEEHLEKAEEFVKDVLKTINIECAVQRILDDSEHVIRIEGDNVGLIIGKRGQTLNAFQYLANIVANRYSNSKVKIFLDASNYRENRKKSLSELSMRMADKVKKSGKSIELDPMTSSERKTIHMALKDNPDVYTYSKGEEPYRKVVISSKNKKQRQRKTNLFEM